MAAMPKTPDWRVETAKAESTDESIVAFATVREMVVTSQPSFGDWRAPNQRGSDCKWDPDVVPAIIEVTKGSPNKYEVDKDTGMLQLDRVLHSAVHYPGDYGYIPATLCGDGDPLDILVIAPYSAQVYQGLEPGIVANCRVVGIMDMEDESGRDEKIIAVLADDRHCSHVKRLEHVPPHLRREIQHFFENYKKLETKAGKPKWAKVLGWGDKDHAMRVLSESRHRYESHKLEKADHPRRFLELWAPNMLHAPQPALDKGIVWCYINVSKGTTSSYGYRHDTSFRHYRYTLDMPYPGDNGWVARTWQKDVGKPLEVQVISAFPIVAESLCTVRVIGALLRSYSDSQDERREDIKLLGAVANDPRMEHVKTLRDINPAIIEHYEHFYLHSSTMKGCSDTRIDKRFEANECLELLAKYHKAYLDEYPDRRIANAPNLWCLPWGPGMANHVDNDAGELTCVVECPKGSCNKYEFNKELGHLTLQRPLYSATHWPGNYGFIPQTVAEDGHPVNVLILSNHPLKEASLCVVRVVGALACTDEKGPDLKVIAVPKKEPRMSEWKNIDDVPSHIKSEMENFFNSYKMLESAWRFCRVQRWQSKEETMQYLQLAHTRFFLFVLPMEKVEARLHYLEEENQCLRHELTKFKEKEKDKDKEEKEGSK